MDNGGSGLVFDGSADYFESAWVPSGAFSVLLTATFDGVPAANTRVIDWQDAGPLKGFSLIAGSTNLQLQVGNAGSATSSTAAFMARASVVAGTPYVLAGTWDGSQARAYLDGALVNTGSAGSMVAAAANLTVGKRATSASNYFDGTLTNNVLFYDRELSLAEVQAYVSDGTIPTGYAYRYKLTANTVDGYALLFDGGTNRVECGSDATLTNFTTNNAFTFEALVKPDALNQNVLPFIMASGANYICVMGDSGNGKYQQVGMEVANQGETSIHEFWGETDLITTGRWYHILAVFSSGATKRGIIYLNEIDDATSEIIAVGAGWTGNIETTTRNFTIGNKPLAQGADRGWQGCITGARVWNRALSEAEVQQRFLDRDTAITSGLMASWDFIEGSGSLLSDSSGNENHGTIYGATWVNVIDDVVTAIAAPPGNTPVNMSDVAQKVYEALRNDAAFTGVKVTRDEVVNKHAGNARSGWVGVYRSAMDYEPRTLAKNSHNYRGKARVYIVCQHVQTDSGALAASQLEELVTNVERVLLNETTVRGAFDMIESLRKVYSYARNKETSLYFQEAVIELVGVTST